MSLGLVQILGGGMLGLAIGRLARTPEARNRVIAAATLLLALLVVAAMATLDWFIGPW
jgi:hypothetical protein